MAQPLTTVPEAIDITDARAFLGQYQRHGPGVHAYLRRRAGRQVADDLFGEVWLRAFQGRASFDGRLGDPAPWFYGIARNVLRAHWRRERRPEPELSPLFSDPWADSDARLHTDELVLELRAAVLELSAEEREVLFLVVWEHLTPTEAATVLGIPAGTARSRLHRARATLRRLLPTAALIDHAVNLKEMHE
jgi:RNA polymerase sigma factor (sigma-70 family)